MLRHIHSYKHTYIQICTHTNINIHTCTHTKSYINNAACKQWQSGTKNNAMFTILPINYMKQQYISQYIYVYKQYNMHTGLLSLLKHRKGQRASQQVGRLM